MLLLIAYFLYIKCTCTNNYIFKNVINVYLVGVGYGTLIVSMIYCIYINVLLAWVLYFLYSSFTSVLPWSHCNNEWNTVNCYSTAASRNASLSNANGSAAHLETAKNATKYTASEEFWR